MSGAASIMILGKRFSMVPLPEPSAEILSKLSTCRAISTSPFRWSRLCENRKRQLARTDLEAPAFATAC